MENVSIRRGTPFANTPSALRAFWGILAVCALLLLPGCPSALQQPPGGDGEPGTLLLAVGRLGAERTILPEIEPDRFVRFDLDFVPGSGQGNAPFSKENWTQGDPIPLPAGTWDLTVTGFVYCEDDGYLEAARGILPGIDVAAGGTVARNVVLSPIAEGGRGTFSWSVSFPPSIASARMDILAMPGGEPADYGPFYFYGDPGTGGGVDLADYVEMEAGQYRVLFTMTLYSNGERETATLGTILRIYVNMESRFEQDFSYRHFPFSLNRILATWDGESWDFAREGIVAAHFYRLEILGVNDGNLAGIEDMFNALVPPGPAPGTAEELESLVDAALVKMESESLGDSDPADRNAAQAAILKLVANTPPEGVGFHWADDGTEVTVSIGNYAVKIDFARPVARPSDPSGQTTLAAQLAALREQTGNVGPHSIWIYDDESITSSAASLEAFAGSNITITLKIIGDNIHTIQLDGTGSLFTIPAGVTLELRNVTLRGVQDNTAPLVIVSQGGNLVMNAGARITGNYNTFVPGTGGVWDLLGGGVRVEGTFDMADGVISGNRSYDEAGDSGGGGVFVYGSSGDFTMSGGEIFGNRAGNWGGGGVFVGGGGSFYLSSGTIEDNEASGGGGGVHVGAHDVGYGTFTMSGGTITLNTTTAGAGGGGVFVNRAPDDGTGRGRFCMTGGVIYDNYATGDTNGGGVFVDGYFEMTGGTIEANEAGGWGGGGVFVSHGAFTMNHVAAIITGNRANNGGGVSIGANGTFTLENGTIKDHNTEIDGGGVFVGRDGSFTMRGGRIEDNMSFRGGGVHVADYGTFEISGGVVFGMDAESLTPPGTPNVAEIGASIYVGQLATAAYAGDLANLGIIETSNHTLPHGAITGVTLSVNGGTPRRYNNLGSVFDSITEIPGDYTITLFEPQYLASWILNPGQNITLLGWNEESGVLTHNGATDLSMFIIQNARLTLGNNITLRGRPAGTPAGAVPSIIVGTSGTLTMLEGSVISGHNTTGFISPISIDGGNARLDIQGGTITGNSNVNQSFAHAAVILNNGVLTMSGGSITGNNTHAPGESADVFMSVNPAVTATLSDTAEIGVIRLSPSDAPDPGGTTRVAIGASWTGSIGRIDLAHNVATLADVAERWNGRMVLSGAGLTASNVTRVALGYFVPGTTPANSQPITGHVIGTAGANLGRLVPSL